MTLVKRATLRLQFKLKRIRLEESSSYLNLHEHHGSFELNTLFSIVEKSALSREE
jgi:hypothetical protein